LPAPGWEDYAPVPGSLAGLVGGKARYARARQAAAVAFHQAVADHEQAEGMRVSELQTARAHYAAQARELEAEVREHNAAVDELERPGGDA
jgi:hypothetical protein